MNLLNAQRLTCYWDTTEKTFQSGRKKALNPHCFCFDMLDTLDLKTSYYEESDRGQTIIAKKTRLNRIHTKKHRNTSKVSLLYLFYRKISKNNGI